LEDKQRLNVELPVNNIQLNINAVGDYDGHDVLFINASSNDKQELNDIELITNEENLLGVNDDDEEMKKSVNNHFVVVNEVDHPPEYQQRPNRKRRSAQGKKKKNRKRNTKLRLLRYQYVLTRSYYYRFKSRNIRKILRHYGVQHRHIKFEHDLVVIGVKSDEARRNYEETLPQYCFDKKNYHLFRK
jgi:hypothetical protein